MTGIHEVFQPPLPVGRLWAGPKLRGELRGRGGGGAGAEGCGARPAARPPACTSPCPPADTRLSQHRGQDGDPRIGSTLPPTRTPRRIEEHQVGHPLSAISVRDWREGGGRAKGPVPTASLHWALQASNQLREQPPCLCVYWGSRVGGEATGLGAVITGCEI